MDQAPTATHLKALLRPKARGSRYRSTSDTLQEIVADSQGECITVRTLSEQLGDRGFGILLLLFALPNAIPLPIPGVSTLTSLPLMFFAAQLCSGKERIWLPPWLAEKAIPMGKLKVLTRKSLPWLMRLERMVKPRLDKVTTHHCERVAGGLILILALLMALPIPFGNLPLGIASAVLALAITERDGVMMIIGWITTIFALCFFTALMSGYAWVIWQLVSGL